MNKILVFATEFQFRDTWKYIIEEARKYDATFIYTGNKDIIRCDRLLHNIIRKYDSQNKLNIRIICDNERRNIADFALCNILDQVAASSLSPSDNDRIRIDFINDGTVKWRSDTFMQKLTEEHLELCITANFYNRTQKKSRGLKWLPSIIKVF